MDIITLALTRKAVKDAHVDHIGPQDAKSSQFQVMDIDAYNAIDTKDPNTFYFITEKSDPTPSNEEATT